MAHRLLPDVLSEPQAHGAPPALYTWVRLGEASRTVLLSPRYPAEAEEGQELAGLQLIVELGGLGLSLVDTVRRHELATPPHHLLTTPLPLPHRALTTPSPPPHHLLTTTLPPPFSPLPPP